MISIVCVYNDKNIFEGWLLKGLKQQTTTYELISINNIDGRYKSASKALNYGGNMANGEYIMFVHQDVYLDKATWLEETERMLVSLNNIGAAGVIGKINFLGPLNQIQHGVPAKIVEGTKKIKNPEKVQTLDECLIIIPKKVFIKLKYDEIVCDDWHLYGVDYCLSIRTLGYNVYVLPLSIIHKSTGDSMSIKYYSTLKKLLKKHKKHYKWIYTTMGNWNIIFPICLQKSYYTVKKSFKSKR